MRTFALTIVVILAGVFVFVAGIVLSLLLIRAFMPEKPGGAAYNETHMQAFTTAYTHFDNTPPGSAVISHPVIHDVAGGTGTYEDPITIAVGHVIEDGVSTPDFVPGTIFYIPHVQRYFIVEDTCGDGPTPQNGPCHTFNEETQHIKDAGAQVWVDMWIDGKDGTPELVNQCAMKVTGTTDLIHPIIQNPRPDYAVVPGPIFQNGTCTEIFSEIPVLQQ